MIGTLGRNVTRATEALMSASDRQLQELLTLIASRRRYFQLIAFRQLGDTADAEDAVQDAFLSAWRHLSQFRKDAHMTTWLTTIVINSARMKMRRIRREVHIPLDQDDAGQGTLGGLELLPDRGPGPEELCRTKELAELLLQCASQLPPGLRRSHRLRILEGLSVRDAAKARGVASGTVKSQTSRACARIRHLMRKANRRMRNAV